MMKDEKWYTGCDGGHYLQQRSSSKSDRNQELRASLFSDLGDSTLTVLDFGCGTGGVVKRIDAACRFGVEIGVEAGKIARDSGVIVKELLSEFSDSSVDVAISFHAIEHVDSPLEILLAIGRVVKPGGRIRLVVPCELPLAAAQRNWKPNADRHLYTWTPLLFGNLATRAGYVDVNVKIAPMPTKSRLVRWLSIFPPAGKIAHILLSLRRNSLNVILDAKTAAI